MTMAGFERNEGNASLLLAQALKCIKPESRIHYRDLHSGQCSYSRGGSFQSKVFDYDRAPIIESMGIDNARKIAVQTAEEREAASLRDAAKSALDEVTAYLEKIMKVKPDEGSVVWTYMYKDGVRKVIDELKHLSH